MLRNTTQQTNLPSISQTQTKTRITPINQLNIDHNHELYYLKARVTVKSEKRSYPNKSDDNPQEIFTIEILDNDNGTINCTFQDEACTKFFEVIQQGKVYKFSGGAIKRQIYSQEINQNQFKITFDSSATIKEVEDDNSIPGNIFNMMNIKDIFRLQKNCLVDVIGIVENDSPVSLTRLKTGEMKSKRSAIIFDHTGNIEVTMWGPMAENINLVKGDILCFKGMKVQEYMNNKNLGIGGSSLVIDKKSQLQEIPEYIKLSAWYQQDKNDNKNGTQATQSQKQITHKKSCKVIEGEAQENENNPKWKSYSEIIAQISFLNTRKSFHYISCTKCPKKVQLEQNGYYCVTCQIHIQEPKYRFIVNTKIADASGSIWVTFFDSEMQQILDGLTCKEFFDMDEDLKTLTINKAIYKEIKIEIVSENNQYMGKTSSRHTLKKIKQIDYIKETQELLEFIN